MIILSFRVIALLIVALIATGKALTNPDKLNNLVMTKVDKTQPSVPDDELSDDPPGRYATVNGLKMYYEIHGTGRPLVFQVATLTTKKVKKKTTHILKPISNFTVSYVAASDAVDINFIGAETFKTGGQITVLNGVTSASGGSLAGTTKFTISPKGTSISPD